MYISEYDAFGPWIYEINDRYRIPPFFDNHIDKNKKSLMMIKVPVKNERRNLKPDMILYDYIISAYNDHIYIAENENGDVITKTIQYSNITAIENSITLLCGELKIFTENTIFEIEYNTVSEEVIIKLIKIIRDKLPVKSKQLFQTPEIKEGKFTFFFNTLWNSVKKTEDDINLMVYQPEMKLNYLNSNIFIKIFKMIFNPMLRASLYLFNDKELLIISRSDGVKIKNETNYNYKYLYISFDKIQSVTKKPSDKYKNIFEINIKVKDNVFLFLVDKNNSYLDYLDNFIKQINNTKFI